ncbi:MAG: tetratricopeptide repeat protein, partial [Planctomycetaceae bacterium]|nr:tetratricopeptide repeat protein [Planctomycetaceae bacterium]
MFPQLLCVAILCSTGTGCALMERKGRQNYETVSAVPQRNIEEARKLNGESLEAISNGDWDEARQKAEESLIADVDYAPAHNTLGHIHYCQQHYYLAAWEFEFAIRLQPEVAEYHNNLGLVFEAAQRTAQAIEQYQLAVDLSPDNYQFLSNLTRSRIRSGERSPHSRHLLEEVVFRDPRSEWRDWAQTQLKTTHLDIPTSCDNMALEIQEAVDGTNPTLGSTGSLEFQ